MKRLWLSSINDDFDPQNDILMGPWCLIGNEYRNHNWDDLESVPDPFKNADEIAYHAKLTTEFAESFLDDLTVHLNEINNTEYNRKFWRILVFPWLLTLVQTTWDRQLRVNQLLKKYSGEEIEIELLKDNIFWGFEDTLDHQVRGVLKHSYNHWLFSRLLEQKIPSNWKVYWISSVPYDQQPVIKKVTLKRKLILWYSNKFLSFTVVGVGIIEGLFFELFIKIKGLFLSYYSDKIDAKPKTVELNWNLNWKELVESTLPLYYKNIKNISRKRIIGKKLHLIGAFPMYNERIKLKLARSIEAGAKIIINQHGGSYGTSKILSFASSVEYVHHKFLSWGWKDHEDYLVDSTPVPSPLLSKYKYKNDTDEIIFVSTRLKPYKLRISLHQPREIIDYRNSQINFLNNIDNQIFKNLLFRLFPVEKEIRKEKKLLKIMFPTLKFLDGKLHEKTMKCKLLIIDHPDTTLNIAMAANIPTVCFWDNNTWPTSRQAEPYFQAMRDASILIDNSKGAAEKVNEIWGDVMGWWEQPHIQKAREEWCWQYARTSKHWRWEWIKAIWSL